MSSESNSVNCGDVGSINLLARVKQLYPGRKDASFYGPGDYDPLVRSFGKVLLQVDDEDWQGDTRVILKRGNEYGMLIFGWGSCSGCDSLQACESYQDIENLRVELESKIKWMSAKELLSYFKTHDWEGDYSWHDKGETRTFVEKATAILSDISNRANNNLDH